MVILKNRHFPTRFVTTNHRKEIQSPILKCTKALIFCGLAEKLCIEIPLKVTQAF